MSDTGAVPTPIRWYVPTPAKFLIATLVAIGVLYASETRKWFWFNQFKGYTVLIAVGVVAAAVAVLLLWMLVGWLAKRRPRFSLATLMLLIFVVAIPLAWLGSAIRQAKMQREVVRWVLQEGADVTILSGRSATHMDGVLDPQDVSRHFGSDESTLLGEEFFRDIKIVSFQFKADLRTRDLRVIVLTDEGLERLSALPTIHEIDAFRSTVTNDGAKVLPRFQNLRTLRLPEAAIDDAGGVLLGELPHLQDVSLNGTKIGDRTVAVLLKNKNLRSLGIADTKVTKAGVRLLADHPGLTSIDISGLVVGDEGIKPFFANSKLISLHAERTGITDKSLQEAPRNEVLMGLFLGNNAITSRGLKCLDRFPSLELLYLRNTNIDNDGLSVFESLSKLSELDLSDTRIDEAGFESLAKRKGLRILDFPFRKGPWSDTSITQDESRPPSPNPYPIPILVVPEPRRQSSEVVDDGEDPSP